jgi:PKD repeat protein
MSESMDRRRFLLTSGLVAAGAALVGPVRPAFAAVAGPGPYGALQAADANGLQLPAGFTSRIIGTTGTTVAGTSYAWHGAPDGGACFPSTGGGWVYVSNSEIGGAAGGASAVKFASDGTIAGAYRILGGTSINCAGGPTPWGTWLSCEEKGATGQVYECDPQQAGQGTVRPALGSFSHEAVAADVGTGSFFLTEDDPNGRLYRFVPTTPGDLSAGQLYAASVSGTSVTWVPTSITGPDRQATTTAFNGGEGIFAANGSVFFTTKGDKRVWELVPATNTLTVLHDCNTMPGDLNAVDNVTVHPLSGDVYVAEDGGNMELCTIAKVNGVSQVAAVVRIVGQASSEVTGPAFSPDGTRLYFSSQRGSDGTTGITYEVTGPFRTSTGPVVPSTVTIPVADDTCVRGGSYATTSYGSSNVLPLKFESGVNYQFLSFLAMDLASVTGTVTAAKLRLNGRLVTAPSRPSQVLGVPSTNWSGATMTWNNRPATDAVIATFDVVSTTNAWHEIDVTSWVAARKAEGATRVAFCIRQATTSLTYSLINSREATSALRPELVVTTTATPPPPPPVNVAPTASFTAAVTGLTVALDGRGSTDTDGTIASYAWNFGDGTTGTGATASKTYATSGTYPVTLTVLDDDGAAGNTAQNVVVTAPATDTIVADDFNRTTTNGFGSAQVGGAWTVASTAANYAVNGGLGRITTPAASQSRSATLASVSARDVEARVDLIIDKTPVGNGSYASVVLRKVGTTEYRLRVRLAATATYREIMRVVNGTETVLLSQTVAGGFRYTAGTPVHLRFRTVGNGTTTLQGRIWFGTEAEPTSWQIQTTDSTAALQAPGGVGVHHYLSGSATNAPIVMSVDDLIVNPAV